jgi:hypothetical protein
MPCKGCSWIDIIVDVTISSMFSNHILFQRFKLCFQWNKIMRYVLESLKTLEMICRIRNVKQLWELISLFFAC